MCTRITVEHDDKEIGIKSKNLKKMFVTILEHELEFTILRGE